MRFLFTESARPLIICYLEHASISYMYSAQEIDDEEGKKL